MPRRKLTEEELQLEAAEELTTLQRLQLLQAGQAGIFQKIHEDRWRFFWVILAAFLVFGGGGIWLGNRAVTASGAANKAQTAIHRSDQDRLNSQVSGCNNANDTASKINRVIDAQEALVNRFNTPDASASVKEQVREQIALDETSRVLGRGPGYRADGYRDCTTKGIQAFVKAHQHSTTPTQGG